MEVDKKPVSSFNNFYRFSFKPIKGLCLKMTLIFILSKLLTFSYVSLRLTEVEEEN